MEPTITLVQVIPHDRLGGMQVIAHSLDDGLPSRGVASSIVDLERVVGDAGGPASLARAWWSLRRRWRHARPDAVMAHTMKNAVFSLTAARLAGVKRRVVVVHASRESLGEARVAMLRALVLTGTATDVVHVGATAAASYDGLGTAVGRRATTIVNGVDVPLVGGTRVEPAQPVLVSAGRLDAGKGVDTLLRAASGLDVHLDIYGDGEERETLQKLADGMGLDASFHGAVGRDELQRAYLHSTVFGFPTLAEGLPLALVEVAAAGLPVIASDLAANREVLGEEAVWCPPGDSAAWHGALARLLADPTHRERLSTGVRGRVDQFRIERMLDEYAALLTGGRAPSRP